MKDLRYLPYLERVACQSALDIVKTQDSWVRAEGLYYSAYQAA